MAKYVYDGPVFFFGRFIGNWHGETMAESEAKAKSNLMYQYKKQNNKIASSGGIAFSGKVREV